MIKAFCPGHITGFFSPVITNDPLTTGSLGSGIRLNKGATVTIEGRASNRKTRITIDGEDGANAEITKHVVNALGPDKSFDITIENELPLSQGFGMSAAGAIALGLCIASLKDMDEYEAYKTAHVAEVEHKGGLGDVAGIMGGMQTIRVKAGMPPYGRTVDTGIEMKFSIVILGPPIDTGSVLSDPAIMNKIRTVGAECVNDYVTKPSEKRFYELSSQFSNNIGIESKKVKRALSELRKEHTASMCMLGNSIFTNAEEDEVHEILGDVHVIECASGKNAASVTRKA
jgi:pantoate kinase